VVASVAGMGAAGDLQPDPVPAPERVRDGQRSNSTGCGVSGAASVRRTIPSQRLIDRLRGVTSQRRACRSMSGTDACR
jgi:hypothetical protein